MIAIRERWGLAVVVLTLVGIAPAEPGAAPATTVKTEAFERDPGWEGLNNRIVPERVPTVTQDFGYSAATNHAGKAKGEIGGRITRATRPAYCADAITTPKTLNDKLTASGTFALTASSAAGGAFFGWFNSNQAGGNGRPVGSLGLNLDTENKGGRLAVRLIAKTNRACGTFITPYIPGKYRPTPIRNDGTRYSWTLAYDPDANGGNGRFEFTLTSNNPNPDDFEGKPFVVDLPAGLKAEGATFDRFGLANGTKSGGKLTIHFDDVTHDGKFADFAADPGWLNVGNRDTYEDRRQVAAHDFGYSEGTNHAGGAAAGEIGGDLWRSGKYGYYADRIDGPLTLDDRLEASGKVMLVVGAPDSDVYLGWFSSNARDDSPAATGNFIGVHIGGPTRVGHYFTPVFATAKDGKGKVEKAPVLVPGKVCDWSIVYDPDGNEANGEIWVMLNGESVTLPMKSGMKAQGGRFDRFGLCTSTIGGQLVRIFLDDVKYTTAAPAGR